MLEIMISMNGYYKLTIISFQQDLVDGHLIFNHNQSMALMLKVQKMTQIQKIGLMEHPKN